MCFSSGWQFTNISYLIAFPINRRVGILIVILLHYNDWVFAKVVSKKWNSKATGFPKSYVFSHQIIWLRFNLILFIFWIYNNIKIHILWRDSVSKLPGSLPGNFRLISYPKSWDLWLFNINRNQLHFIFFSIILTHFLKCFWESWNWEVKFA